MAVAPAECKFPLFRQQFWAAASWAVEPTVPGVEGGSFSGSSLEDSRRDICKPVRRLSLKQELHVRSIDKLDLSSLPREDEKPTEELQARREKFAFFEKHCSPVYDGIFLGGDWVARNHELLLENGVTHVVNCVGMISANYHAPQLTYKTLYLQDAPGEDITCIFYDVFDYIQAALSGGGRVYVHCSQGVSRSATVVIAYLMYTLDQPYDEVCRMVKAQRGVTNPNIGFTCQLLQWHKRRSTPVEPGAPRVYQVVPQSQYASSYLVPKQIKEGGQGWPLAALDPRGAFVCHTSVGVFVWTGASCPAPMAAAAKRIGQQIAKYDIGPGAEPVAITQGSEPAEFFESMCGNMSARPTSMSAAADSEVGNAADSAAGNAGRVGWAPSEVRRYDAGYRMFEEAMQLRPQTAHSALSSDTPRSNPKTPRDDPDPSEGSPNHRSRKALRSRHGGATPRGETAAGQGENN